jgi:hypothetical protein
MKKVILALALCLTGAVSAVAQTNNIGSCGWGSRLFKGEKGIAPQVLAVTTNGTSGNQTFAITSGTSGCTQDGVVTSNWKTAAFIDGNMTRLAMDVSRGEGESLEALASLLNVESQDDAAFKNTLQSNFSNIFANADISSEQVAVNLKGILAQSNGLVQYADRV